MKIIYIIIAILPSLLTSIAFADSNQAHRHGHAHDGHDSSVAGEPGDLKNVSRTVELKMTFKHFEPSKVSVSKGETIRFVLKNISDKKHEFMIATMKELEEHAKEMRKNPDWVHIDPNQIAVDTGKTGELIWQFTKTGTVPFACPRHGHFKAMRGEVSVAEK